jgi:hypothetical protein
MEEKLASFWWTTVPRIFGKLPGLSGLILKDGGYLQRWPQVAAWLPAAALLFGLISGLWHFGPGPTYTFSLFLMALMIAVASSGAVVGAWLCAGYALSDFLLYGHFGIQPEFNSLVTTGFSLMLAYILLALLLVRAVFLTNAIARRALSWIKPSATSAVAVQAVFQALIQGGLVWAWAHAAPSLIRPVFTWNGGYPPTEAMRPLQEDGWILVAVGALGGTGRAVAEYLASRKSPALPAPPDLQSDKKTAYSQLKTPPIAKFVFQSCFTTFMLSGLLATWLDAILLVVALFLIRYGSYLLAGKLGLVDKLLLRLPWIVRFIVGLAFSYFLANWIVTAMWSQTETFRPVLVSVVLSILLIVLLMPETRKKPALDLPPVVTAQ